jgi:hypothetical protein
MNHGDAVYSHLYGAITVWGHAGRFAPTLWAQSDTQRLIAMPFDDESARLKPEEQVWMLAWMAECIYADAIGRTDEAWVRTFDAATEPIKAGDLRIRQETDPEVRTALIVQSLLLDDGDMLCAMGTSSMDDFGERTWTTTMIRVIDQSTADLFEQSRAMIAVLESDGSPQKSRLTRLAGAFRHMGWDLVLC